MTARIYKPAKTAMQSGRNKTDNWILEFFKVQLLQGPSYGLAFSKDTQKQVKLKFKSKDELSNMLKKIPLNLF